jgi:2TM family of unknown function (DUF5676)
MSEKLNEKAFASALMAISALLYTACAVLFTIAPQASLGFFSRMFHGIDITKIATATKPSLGSVALGLAEIVLATYIIGWTFAALYNRLLEK